MQSEQQPAIDEKFGVLMIQDAPGGANADFLRLASVPTWTVRTGSDLDWVLRRASARPSLALVDLRLVTSERSPRVVTLAEIVATTGLPTVLIGAVEDEAALFRDVRAALPADAGPVHVLEAVHAHIVRRIQR